MTNDRLRLARSVSFLLVLALLAAGRARPAEKGFLFVQVTDPQDRPLAGVQIALPARAPELPAS